LQPDGRTELTQLKALLPSGSGVVVYTRESSAPWRILSVIGDGPGVFGVPSDALRQVWSELIHPEDEARLRILLEGLAVGDAATVDYRLRGPLGGERWVRDSICRQGGDLGAIVGVVRDVSVERTLRGQIAALEERIWRAQRVDSLGALAAGVAHDLSNLLTAILSAAQLAENEELPTRAREDLAVVTRSAKRGSEFVRQILRFAGRDAYRSGPVDLNELLQDLGLILGRSLGGHVSLVIEMDPALPPVHCDPVQMEQAVLNLVLNARDAMPEGGRVAISTYKARVEDGRRAHGVTLPAGEYVVLSVSDTGRGISQQALPRIFEPFFSTKAPATTGSGSGLGLSTVQRVARSHGGGVVVESEEGRGTTFAIYVPLERAAGSGSFAASQEGEHVRARLLVAESDPAVRDIARRVLQREGYSVLAVGSARDAIQLLDHVRPAIDLIVTDLSLPDRSGADLVRLIRSRHDRIPVVYLGAPGDRLPLGEEERGRALVEKPFAPPVLLDAIERALFNASSAGAMVRTPRIATLE
jgi:signal transduction histidine kinase/CheY-like chemotaxis protein